MENINEGNEPQDEEPVDDLSQEELMSRIERDATAGASDQVINEKDSNDLLSKLGFSKKNQKRSNGDNEEKGKVELEELRIQLAESNEKTLRIYADFDNFKKRNTRDRLELIKTAGSEVIIALLPVLDDFQRALKQMEATADPMLEGVRLIYQKLLSILEAKGLKPMQSIGEVFNADMQDAITEIPATDEASKGSVVDEIESGYYLNDRIIRHAKVIVAK